MDIDISVGIFIIWIYFIFTNNEFKYPNFNLIIYLFVE